MRQIEKNNNNSSNFLVFGRGPQTKSRVVASLRGAVPCSTSEVKQLRLLSGFSSCVYLVAAGPRFRALQMGSGLIRILGYLWLYILQRIILRVILLPCPLQVKWPFSTYQEPQFLFPREKIIRKHFRSFDIWIQDINATSEKKNATPVVWAPPLMQHTRNIAIMGRTHAWNSVCGV